MTIWQFFLMAAPVINIITAVLLFMIIMAMMTLVRIVKPHFGKVSDYLGGFISSVLEKESYKDFVKKGGNHE